MVGGARPRLRIENGVESIRDDRNAISNAISNAFQP
jgi:hypothetical protein